jgi:aldose 1-epimerase
MSTPHTLQNAVWNAVILPETGASIAIGQVWHAGAWHDVLRPTPASDYANAGKCSSFIMLPWCNRIKGGLLRFDGQTYPLETTPDDGTARHGEARKRAWQVISADATHIRMTVSGGGTGGTTWPFPYTAEAEYRLDGADFVWVLRLTNTGHQPMPAGFGHHPYFVRRGAHPTLTVPCNQQFILTDYMATGAPVPLSPALDFTQPRPLDDHERNDLLTTRDLAHPNVLHYPDTGLTVEQHADPVFAHTLVYAPTGAPFVAVEPQSNANDGFNLHADGITGSGVFVLGAGETVSGTVRLRKA